jgi:hypothetical protein
MGGAVSIGVNYTPAMFSFFKVVLITALCSSIGALFGAYVADHWSKEPAIGGLLGGLGGIAFALAAAGDTRGRWLDPFFPPGNAKQ